MKGRRLTEGQPASPLTDARRIYSAVKVQVHTTTVRRAQSEGSKVGATRFGQAVKMCKSSAGESRRGAAACMEEKRDGKVRREAWRAGQVGAGGRSQAGGGVGLRECHHL